MECGFNIEMFPFADNKLAFFENDNFAHNFEQQQFFCVTHYPLKTNKNNQTKKQNENQLYHVF